MDKKNIHNLPQENLICNRADEKLLRVFYIYFFLFLKLIIILNIS